MKTQQAQEKPKRLYVVDQAFKVIEDGLKKPKPIKMKFKIDELEQKRKTTIILSRDNIERIAELGHKGETYDNIINRVIDYDISLERRQSN